MHLFKLIGNNCSMQRKAFHGNTKFHCLCHCCSKYSMCNWKRKCSWMKIYITFSLTFLYLYFSDTVAVWSAVGGHRFHIGCDHNHRLHCSKVSPHTVVSSSFLHVLRIVSGLSLALPVYIYRFWNMIYKVLLFAE